jgi:hypothetical protein
MDDDINSDTGTRSLGHIFWASGRKFRKASFAAKRDLYINYGIFLYYLLR